MTTYDLTTLGEAQIRLTVPRGDRLATCRELRLTPAGSEANVAGLLAQLGRRTAFASVIPHGDLAQRFIDEYRSVGVDLSHCIRCEGRMALYFMEPGDPPLPAKVVYDRLYTKFREIRPETFDWEALLDTRVLFVTGITAALTDNTGETVTWAVREAARRGVKVALDVNYRSLLWPAEKARSVLEPLLEHVSILFCSRPDGIKVFGMEGDGPAVNVALRKRYGLDHVVFDRRDPWLLLLRHRGREDLRDRAGSRHGPPRRRRRTRWRRPARIPQRQCHGGRQLRFAHLEARFDPLRRPDPSHAQRALRFRPPSTSFDNQLGILGRKLMSTASSIPAGMTALEQIDSRPLTKNQKNLITLVVTGNISEFFDMFLIGFAVSSLLKDPAWHLQGFEAGWILAMSGLGTVIGAILWGRLADRIGRKASFSWCVLLFTLFTLASVFTPTDGWMMLAILRVFVGIGVGGLNITSIPYVQEFVPAKQRGLLSGLASVFISVRACSSGRWRR